MWSVVYQNTVWRMTVVWRASDKATRFPGDILFFFAITFTSLEKFRKQLKCLGKANKILCDLAPDLFSILSCHSLYSLGIQTFFTSISLKKKKN